MNEPVTTLERVRDSIQREIEATHEVERDVGKAAAHEEIATRSVLERLLAVIDGAV